MAPLECTRPAHLGLAVARAIRELEQRLSHRVRIPGRAHTPVKQLDHRLAPTSHSRHAAAVHERDVSHAPAQQGASHHATQSACAGVLRVRQRVGAGLIGLVGRPDLRPRAGTWWCRARRVSVPAACATSSAGGSARPRHAPVSQHSCQP